MSTALVGDTGWLRYCRALADGGGQGGYVGSDLHSHLATYGYLHHDAHGHADPYALAYADPDPDTRAAHEHAYCDAIPHLDIRASLSYADFCPADTHSSAQTTYVHATAQAPCTHSYPQGQPAI